MNQNHAHQEKLFDPDNARPVALFGAGSVGSLVAFNLAKMGVTDLHVWDDDVISSHNVPMSLYGPSHAGRYKVDVLAEMLELLTGTKITTHREMYAGQSMNTAAVISCVDTMKARDLIWQQVQMNPLVEIFLDTRTQGTYVEIYCIQPCSRTDIVNYEQTLFIDDKAVQQQCGMHGIIYASERAAGVVSLFLAHYWQKGVKKKWRYIEQCDTLGEVFPMHLQLNREDIP